MGRPLCFKRTSFGFKQKFTNAPNANTHINHMISVRLMIDATHQKPINFLPLTNGALQQWFCLRTFWFALISSCVAISRQKKKSKKSWIALMRIDWSSRDGSLVFVWRVRFVWTSETGDQVELSSGLIVPRVELNSGGIKRHLPCWITIQIVECQFGVVLHEFRGGLKKVENLLIRELWIYRIDLSISPHRECHASTRLAVAGNDDEFSVER